MRNYKKYLAAALAATMVVGSSVVAHAADYVSSSDVTITDSNAADGTIGGNGQMAGSVNEDVFSVVVPGCMTGAEAFNGFDFVLDPEMLISKTDAVKYISDSNAGVTGFDENKTLYFLHKRSGTIGDTSDFVKVTNKSSIDVDISLKPAITGITAIKLSDTATFADDSTSMYMAVTDGSTPTAIKADGTTEVKKTIAGNINAYKTVVNASGDYDFALKEDVDPADFDTYEFALTGACNDKADWSSIAENPNVQITWSIKPSPDPVAPSITSKTYTYVPGTDVAITVALGEGSKAATGIESVSFVNGNDRTVVLTADTDYTFAGTTLTIKDAKLATVTGTKFTITFNDTAKTAVEVTISK